MEQDDLKSIAAKLFQIMPEQTYKSKIASEIEVAVQALLNQLATALIQDHILTARVKQVHSEVEDGSVGCQDCQKQLQLHKHDQPLRLKTIFGSEISLSRNQYFCPNCQSYSTVADSELGLIGRKMTPRLALITALCGASWSYEVASAFLDSLLGV